MSVHPAKTMAQRRVLDAIGCGNHSPIMAKATCEALLRAGLIEEKEPERTTFSGLGVMTIRRFDMPIHVHIQWCEAMAAQVGDA